MADTFAHAGPGVQVAQASQIADSIKRLVDGALATIPDGKRGAFVAVAARNGEQTETNFAVAAKVGDQWKVTGWFGKTWRAPEDGFSVGAGTQFSW